MARSPWSPRYRRTFAFPTRNPNSSPFPAVAGARPAIPGAASRKGSSAGRPCEAGRAEVALEPVIEVPELEVAEKIGIGVGELGLRRSAACCLSSGRSRGSWTSRAAAMISTSARQLPRPRRGSSGQCADRRGAWRSWRPIAVKLAVVVDGAQFEERFVAVADRFGPGRIEKGEFVDGAKVEGQRLQDHAARLVRWISGDGERSRARIIFFAEEADADAGADAAAAALCAGRPRLARRLRSAVAGPCCGAIAADAGGAGVDDVADARHGERRFGHVRREDDPAAAVRSETRGSARRRKPGVEGQNFRIARRRCCARGASDGPSRMSRSVGRKTRISPFAQAAELFDRVGDAAMGSTPRRRCPRIRQGR